VTIHTRWITSIDDLRALGPRYDAMVLASGDMGLFYQLGWLERTWPYYEARLRGALSFLIAEQDGELLALAPLMLGTKGWLHARQRVLGFVGGTRDELDNWVPGFLFAARARSEQANIMTEFSDAVAQRRWDLFDLRFVRPSCPSLDVLPARFAGLRATHNPYTTPRAHLEHGWTHYWAGRSRRLMRILERGRKRAAEDRLPIVYEVTSDVPVERRGEAEAIHRSRQERIRSIGRARTSPFEDPYAQRVFWSLIDFAASRGQLRAHWLRLGDRTAAYVIALHHADTTFVFFNAIDPATERYHPGNLILAALIEHEATEHQALMIDMMIGANLTKTLFATEELVNTDLAVVHPHQLRSKVTDAWIRVARQLAVRTGR
jgi:CelD/BcsL family acetyltransferase involved in cellulose biosynthesis